jgi:hypothetical protein
MENLDSTGRHNLMATASSRVSPGLGQGVDVGAMVGCSVGVGPGLAVTLGESPVIGESLLSVAAQADATREATTKMPTIKKRRNAGRCNLYLSSVESHLREFLNNLRSIRWDLRSAKAWYFLGRRLRQINSGSSVPLSCIYSE